MARAADLSGRVFGKLTAKRPTERRDNGSVVWLCECECGNTAEVIAAELRFGSVTSCGCGAERNRRNAETAGIVEGTKLSMLNSRLPANNTSGVKGVRRRGERFVAQIKFQGKNRHLGTFDTLEEAAAARHEAEEELFGPVLERHGRKLGE